MTTEQTDQWQRAILRAYPAPAPEGQEGTLEQWQQHQRAEAAMLALLPGTALQGLVKNTPQDLGPWGLHEANQRLAKWGAPGWAIQLRESLIALSLSPDGVIERSAEIVPQAWHPAFALRSEVALVGIQILYPSDKQLEEVYSRVLVRFALEALRRIVEYAHTAPPALKEGYEPIVELFTFCEWFLSPTPGQFPGLPQFPLDPIDFRNMDKLEIYWAVQMGDHLLQEIRSILGYKEEVTQYTWASKRTSFIDQIVIDLNRQHQWCTGGVEHEVYGSNYMELIADAFLVALEAECPVPEWLP